METVMLFLTILAVVVLVAYAIRWAAIFALLACTGMSFCDIKYGWDDWVAISATCFLIARAYT